MEAIEFQAFPKMPRLVRECIITEKIDGTNAQVFIADDGVTMLVGSRSRWIQPGKQTDNHGFAGWCEANRDELLRLGPGRHYGEWWGQGIQRNYGLTEKRFSLFNVSRWGDDAVRPACCSVVPVLYRGMFSTVTVEQTIDDLRLYGSRAVEGYLKPEGIVVFHVAAGMGFKRTLEKDESPKGAA